MLTRTLTLMLRLAKSIPRRFGFTLESDGDANDADNADVDTTDADDDGDDDLNKR